MRQLVGLMTVSLAVTLTAAVARAEGGPKESGGPEEFRPLFNGRDLSGWVNVNCAPQTFSVRDGVVVSTGKPTGVIRTERQYENFILELEWKHIVPKGNAGLFVWSHPLPAVGKPFTRSIEVQILDGRNTESHTSHGDVFPIQGASMTPDRPHPNGSSRCLPSEHRCKPAGQWNHYRVECRGGVLKLAVNGKVVSGGSSCNPRKGYICLESEGSECHFRNIRIQELPPGDPQPEHVAPLAEDFRTLYNGLDLSGWKVDEEAQASWKPSDWRLLYTADGAGEPIWSTDDFKDVELQCDLRTAKKGQKVQLRIHLRGSTAYFVQFETNDTDWQRFRARQQGDRMQLLDAEGTVRFNIHLRAKEPFPQEAGPLGLQVIGGPAEIANLFVRRLDR